MLVFDDLWTDACRGARSLSKAPGFTLTAVATLALGIGANTAVFSVVNAVLLRPLPYSRPQTRVMLWSRWTGFDKTWVSDGEVFDYRRTCRSFKQVAAWGSDQANLTGDGAPVRIGVATISANTFSTLGADPLLGRAFTLEEDRPGADAVAVLGFGLWQNRYGGDPRIVGRSILLDGLPRTVVGVMPQGFRLPTDFGVDAAEPTALWLPLALDPGNPDRDSHSYYAAAELAPGASVEGANAELATLAANWTREGLYHEAMRFQPFVVPLEQEVLGGVRPAMLLLVGAVSFLLLIAATNVASLLLARAESRGHELAVRQALGAGRGRLLRQVLAESAVLALPSAGVALALAWAALRLLRAGGAAGIPRASDVALDARVLAFTLGASMLATLIFSLAPALRTLRLNPSRSLREGGSRAGVSGRRQRLRSLLVVGELALSVVLLLGAGLMLRSLSALQRVDLGFSPQGVLTLRLSLPALAYDTPEKTLALYRQLLARVRGVPGVRAAGLLRSLPLGAPIGDWGLDIEGYVESAGREAKGDWQVASDGALEALGERLVRGRLFAETDTSDSQQVALVNETLAQTYWPGLDPLGRRLRQGSRADRPWASVVGIVADVRHNGIAAPIKEKFYRPHSQFHRSTGFAIRDMNIVVRTAGDAAALAAPLRAAVGEVDPNLPIAALRLMTDVVSESVSTPRLAGRLLLVFAGLALTLSTVGLYGLLSYLVGQRRQEIGVRLAVGAGRGDILRLVLGQGLRLVVAGLALGSLAAVALARLMKSLLYEVRAHDPATFAAAPLVLLAVALVASYLPARRASKVDPVVILRSQ